MVLQVPSDAWQVEAIIGSEEIWSVSIPAFIGIDRQQCFSNTSGFGHVWRTAGERVRVGTAWRPALGVVVQSVLNLLYGLPRDLYECARVAEGAIRA